MGSGVVNQQGPFDFQPTTGALTIDLCFAQHMPLSRTQHNDIATAAINAGGMSNVSAAYTAIRGALDTIEDGRDAWLDRMTTGQNSTETDLLRRGVVWRYVTLGVISSPPQP